MEAVTGDSAVFDVLVPVAVVDDVVLDVDISRTVVSGAEKYRVKCYNNCRLFTFTLCLVSEKD